VLEDVAELRVSDELDEIAKLEVNSDEIPLCKFVMALKIFDDGNFVPVVDDLLAAATTSKPAINTENRQIKHKIIHFALPNDLNRTNHLDTNNIYIFNGNN
jgi:hypothetical protein